MKRVIFIAGAAILMIFLIISDSSRVRLYDELEKLSYRVKALELEEGKTSPEPKKPVIIQVPKEIQAQIQNNIKNELQENTQTQVQKNIQELESDIQDLRNDLLRHKHKRAHQKPYFE